MKKWGSLKEAFLALEPITELVKIKHAIYDAFPRKMTTTTGDWTDKTKLLLSQFGDILPAASMQGVMAILGIQETNSNAFTFSDMDIQCGRQLSHATTRTH